ncbi:hypothetical protein ALO41_102942 [Pseudomonas amygdali pv. ulmi]|uniref:Uncharacterized protein n=1 Tax=Pseudomonas amygdali pv. ulmi TaxID=251720 RepID=A0A0Q0CLP6_PSEA0|nr:hypothetical protein ALO41_102942 [Pseudomonas amygdali pv. ulmi]
MVDRGRFVGHQARRVFFQMAGADCRRLWRVVTNGLNARLSIAVMVCRQHCSITTKYEVRNTGRSASSCDAERRDLHPHAGACGTIIATIVRRSALLLHAQLLQFLITQLATQDLADVGSGQNLPEFHATRPLVAGQVGAHVLHDLFLGEGNARFGHDENLDGFA